MSHIKQEQNDIDTMLSALDGSTNAEKAPAKPEKQTVTLNPQEEDDEPCTCPSCSLTDEEREQVHSCFYELVEDSQEVAIGIAFSPFEDLCPTLNNPTEMEFYERIKDPQTAASIILSMLYRIGMLEARVSMLEGNDLPALTLVANLLNAQDSEEK